MCQINTKNAPCVFENYFSKKEVRLFGLPTDSEGYCLFHSQQLDWKRSFDFTTYLNSYLAQEASQEQFATLTFHKVVFVKQPQQSEIDLRNRQFQRKLRFESCRFADVLGVNGTVFTQTVEFINTVFDKASFFREITCKGSAFWNDCTFTGPAYFNNAVFDPQQPGEWVSFNFSVFRAQANFPHASFCSASSDTNFQVIDFEDNVYFTSATFAGDTTFNGTHFMQQGDFRRAEFNGNVKFNARPDKNRTVRFKKGIFGNTLFNNSEFEDMQVQGEVVFTTCRLQTSSFNRVSLEREAILKFEGDKHTPVFNGITSFNLDRSRIGTRAFVSFLGCDVSKIYPAHLAELELLKEDELVYFDSECNFDLNTSVRVYEGLSGRNWWVFREVLNGLRSWTSMFFEDRGVKIALDERLSESTIIMKVSWQLKSEYNVFKRMFGYYFEALSIQDHQDLDAAIATQIDKLKSDFLSNAELQYSAFFERNLKRIIEQVKQYITEEFALLLEEKIKHPQGIGKTAEAITIIGDSNVPGQLDIPLLDEKINELASGNDVNADAAVQDPKISAIRDTVHLSIMADSFHTYLRNKQHRLPGNDDETNAALPG